MLNSRPGDGQATSTSSVASKPNIIVIWGDNLGWADLNCYGCPYYATPNIDGLAKDGARFLNAYAAAAACTPSRVGFLTGRYPARLPIARFACDCGQAVTMRWYPVFRRVAAGPTEPVLRDSARRANPHPGNGGTRPA